MYHGIFNFFFQQYDIYVLHVRLIFGLTSQPKSARLRLYLLPQYFRGSKLENKIDRDWRDRR